MKGLHLVALLAMSLTAWSAQACTTDAECDDGNVCNGSEACQGGLCIAGQALVCDDGNPCTIDACDMTLGCTYTTTTGCRLSGKKLLVGEQRLALQTRPEMRGPAFPANNTADDPVLNGASLRVYTTVGDMFDNTYPLPRQNWEYLGAAGENRGYRYIDLLNVNGPISVAFIRQGHSSKVKGHGPMLNFSLGTDPEPVTLVLHFGNSGKYFCLAFGGRTNFNPNVRFTALASPPPTSCP